LLSFLASHVEILLLCSDFAQELHDLQIKYDALVSSQDKIEKPKDMLLTSQRKKSPFGKKGAKVWKFKSRSNTNQ
jgi:hypothetical protein